MKKKLDQIKTADGKELALYQYEEDFYIEIDDKDLMMFSRDHISEEELARLAWHNLGKVPSESQVLIGGLGMGYTLRAILDLLPSNARVTVAEIFPKVVRWNRELLGHLAQYPLNDPRMLVEEADVNDLLQANSYDIILLDVDNGPKSFILETNHRLYNDTGLARLRQALKPGGVLAIWSISSDEEFIKCMQRAGFKTVCQTIRPRNYAIFLGIRDQTSP